MILGLMLFIAGAAVFSVTVVWIIHDIVKSGRGRVKAHRHGKKQVYIIPPTNEMYEGIRIVDTK